MSQRNRHANRGECGQGLLGGDQAERVLASPGGRVGRLQTHLLYGGLFDQAWVR